MNTKSLYKNLFILAVPIALQNMISLSIGLADSMMVGSLGELSISGVYICNQIQTVLQMLAAGIGAAQIVLAAQYWGKGDKESVKNIINIALRIAILCGLLFWTVVFFFPEKVLGLYTDDQQVLLEALKFARVVCFSYLFFCISNVLMASLRCIGTVKIGLYISIISFILNIGLNWILIFGHLGAPKLGIAGAAIATLTTRIVEFIIVVGYVLFVDKKLKYKLRNFSMSNWQLLKDFFRYGTPVILGDVLWGINLTVQGMIIGRLGASSIAAVSIANTIFSLVSVGVYGTAQASSIIIGNAAGEGDVGKIKFMSGKLQRVFLGVGICTGVLLFSIRNFILSFYSITPETRHIASLLILILSITVIGTSYQMSTLTGIVRAGGATHFVLVNDIFFVWGIVIPSSLIMAFVVGAPTWIIFLCLKSDQVLKCIVAVIEVNRYDWIKKLTKEFQPAKSA